MNLLLIEAPYDIGRQRINLLPRPPVVHSIILQLDDTLLPYSERQRPLGRDFRKSIKGPGHGQHFLEPFAGGLKSDRILGRSTCNDIE